MPLNVGRLVWGSCILLLGVLCLVGGWRLVNGSHYTQGNFLHYFVMVNNQSPTSIAEWAAEWAQGRWDSALNTLVPFYLYLFHASDPWVNSVTGPSPPVVHFYFQYWNSLPFAVGIVFFPWLIVYMGRVARETPWLFISVILVPFILFAVYWGSYTSGMMREGLHPWLLTLLILCVWISVVSPRSWDRSRLLRVCLVLRAVETLLMLVLPTIATARALVAPGFIVTDFVALFVILVGLSWLGLQTWRIPGSELDRTVNMTTSSAS